jgi:hypothetical protein
MTIEDAIYDELASTMAVTAYVGSRIYRGWIPQRAKFPCITYQRISTTPLNASAGPTGTRHIRVQVDVWASQASTARAISNAVAGALEGWTNASDPEVGSCNMISDQDMNETDSDGDSLPNYRVSQDYSIWSSAS